MTGADTPAIRGTPHRALSILTIGYFVGFAGVVVYGPVATEFEDVLGLSGVLLGLLVAAPQLTGSLLRIPFSAWADSAGAKKPFAILLCLSALGMGGLLTILLTTYPDGLSMAHYPLIFVFGALSGCGIAAFSVGITDITYWYRANRRGTMLALFAGLGTTSPGLFTIVSPIALGAVGLTGTYAAWFVFLLVGTVVFVMFAVDSPYFQYRKRGLEESEAKAKAADAGQELFPSGDAMQSIRTAATIPRSWMLTAMFFVSFGGYLALTTWYPSYWHNLHGLDIQTAGIVTALTFTLLSALFRAAGGAVSDRFGGEVTTISSFVVVVISTFALVFTHDLYVAIVATVTLGAGLGVASAAIYQLLPRYVPDAVGGASGLVGGLGGFGGFVVPPILGLFVDLQGVSGYATGFVVYLVVGLLALAIAVSLYRDQPAPTTPSVPAPADD
ncbi:MFS transporter, NNP family, nitrate/nitrite transporter [Natronorubrum sediminis]|uniref:MFS transporter, NNP family, nitrate/nitrite transporter n=1 Tax=Natronorubrum sediminis TaxID=640943 RepID=A0A1H6FR16_9EURY|nr:MFS transporter [Natronorubrum sediminis]SEH13346.1 MFS transporter, NNP family, nitrate/nitrite transporter [Natronorubrum sediminis]